MDSSLEFLAPISFGWTAQYLDSKTQTRREWKDSHAAKFCNAFDRAAAAGLPLRVPAIDKGYHAGGRQIGWCTLSSRPYKEPLAFMKYSDLAAEGGMCATVKEFVQKYFRGNGALEVWVINFTFSPLPNCELEFVPVLERPFYAATEEDSEEVKIQIESSLRDRRWGDKVSNNWFEPDPEYDDLNFNRELAIKRYLKLVSSPACRVEPAIESDSPARGRPPKSSKPQDVPLPSYLDTTARKIVPALRKKILGAVLVHQHFFGLTGKINVRTLFYETKLCGFRYNYKSQKWEYG